VTMSLKLKFGHLARLPLCFGPWRKWRFETTL
jgi:hypothetical protein